MKNKRQLRVFLVLGLVLNNLLSAQDHLLTFNVDLLTKNEVANIPTLNTNEVNYNASIQVFLPGREKATGRAVVICPGGGYSGVALDYEGYRWASYFNKQGIVAIVLKYRLPKGNYKIPVSDAQAAMKIVNDSAKVWNVNSDDVGIMGFSAGGHLASTIATHSLAPLKPKFQILYYPVITMDKAYTHLGSHDNFLGTDANKELEILYSNEKQVTKKTPPAFIVLTAEDQIVPPDNSINFFRELIKNNVFATLHVYPTGAHGSCSNVSYKYYNEILSELSLWLNEIK